MSNTSEELHEEIHPLKKLISGNQLLIDIIRREKNIIEKDYDDCDKVKEEFFLTMLSEGYIDENYSDFLSTSYNEQFTDDEYIYIQNLRDELKPNFKLKIEHIHSVEKKILSYKWTNASVLNNDILTDILEKKQPERIKQFISAIKHYCYLYKSNIFLEQYFNSISEKEKKYEIIDNLLEELSNEIEPDTSKKMNENILLSLFSEKTSNLFCRMIDKYTDISTINNYGNSIREFFKERTIILNEVLEKSIQETSLKEKIKVLNLEIENLSYYNNKKEVQQLLISECMFKVSIKNLDYLLSQQNEIPLHFYYDYIRKKDKIKTKIIDSEKINNFIEELNFKCDKISIFPETIVELLFNPNLSDESAEKIVKKIDDEFVDLGNLIKIYGKKINQIWPKVYSNIIHSLIQYNKLKIDFNNLLYVFGIGDEKDTILFAKKEQDKYKKEFRLTKIDEYTKKNYLDPFYQFLLTKDSVDSDLFEEISNVLLNQGTDIINLVIPIIDDNTKIATLKLHKLIKLSFKRFSIEKTSSKAFLTIIKNEFDFVYNDFDNIKEYSKNSLYISLSIILKNEDNILNENQLNSLMEKMTFSDFREIILIWNNNDKREASKNVVNIFNKEHLLKLLKIFNLKQVLNFFDDIKKYINSDVAERLKSIIINLDHNNTKSLISIANKYGLGKRAIYEYNIKLQPLKNISYELQKNLDYDQKWIDACVYATKSIINVNFNRIVNDLFVIGRHLYKTIENGSININDFLSNNALTNYSKSFKLNPVLCGIIFEAYFNNNGNLKLSTLKLQFDQIIKELEKNYNSYGLSFIRECLSLFKNQLVYIPGDSDMFFNIEGNILKETIFINNIKCNNIGILSSSNKSNNLPIRGSIKLLKSIIHEQYLIPEYRIKFKPSNENIYNSYCLTNEKKQILELNLIASKINHSTIKKSVPIIE